jgi:hypothetical protein
MAVGFPLKTTYANGDVYSASDVNDTNGTVNLLASAQQAAGKNVLINGLLDVWQRSTSAVTTIESYNAQDRWLNYASTSSTFARESTVVPTGCQYSCKITIGASAAAVQSAQVIETANAAPYAGKTMTFSGYYQSSATPTVFLVVQYSTAVDVAYNGSWTTITATSGGSGTATSGSFARISGVYSIPSTAKSLKVLWYTGSIASSLILYWGGMQFEASSIPTALVRNAGTIQGELAACQRYYAVINGYSIGGYATGSGFSIMAPLSFPTAMRTQATVTFVNTGTTSNFSSIATISTSTTQAGLQLVASGAGFSGSYGNSTQLTASAEL